jgi:hypothetical protein
VARGELATTEIKVTKGRGQPPAMTEKVVRALETAFKYDWTVKKACNFAGISTSTYYDFLKLYPEYAEKFAILRESASDLAQQVIIDDIEHNKNTNTAKWWLEKRRSEKFAPRASVDITHTHTVDDKLLEIIKDYRQIESDGEQDVIDVEPLPNIGE